MTSKQCLMLERFITAPMDPKELQDIIDLLDYSEKKYHTRVLQICSDSTNPYNTDSLNGNVPISDVLNTEDNQFDTESEDINIFSPTMGILEPTVIDPALKKTEVVKEDDDVIFVSEVKWQPPVINEQTPNNTAVITSSYTCRCINCQCNHRGMWFYCRSCSFQASDWTCLKQHTDGIHIYNQEKKQHTDDIQKPNREKKFACYFCPYRAEYRKSLTKHMKIHGEKIIFQCNACDYETDNRFDYNGHMKSHTGEKYLKCPDCEYRTTHKGSLKVHVEIHTKEKSYECYECGHKTSTKRSLIRHIQTHSDNKIYKCKDCSYESKEKRYIERHIEIHNHTRDRSNEELRCDKCDYITYTDRSMQWHLRVHSGERLFECFECEYKTNCSSNFRKHELLHDKQNKI